MHRRWLFISAAAALVVVSLVLVLLPDHEADARHAAATPVVGTPANVPPTTGSPTPSGGATTASAKPSAKSTPRTPSTASAKPSATDAPQAPSAGAPLAGRIRPALTYEGVATFYDSDGGGACLYDPSGDVMTGAMNSTDYESAKACGAYVSVRAANGASITVRITNECPGECAPGQIDLSAEAFAKLAAPSRGRIAITWKLVSPSTPGTMSIRYKTGSSRYWCGIQVIGHRNPVGRLEVRAGSGWRQLSRADYNYFISGDGTGCGGAIRITDIFGERLTVDGIAIRPNVMQPTRVQFAKH
ncbi:MULTISPECIES: expansin EXLX1 family cellulose-binding protein [unclassified Streptomyces]|uniref:expansin EXLX1 family cellulose-binding protein n=1 Tax=unclassified Streptomyces TaxID=2593676 RepID=UPI002E808654|nr:expansin EXLX1 family cellulose-binding protein [Streptomyces sp. NBC_00589]WTI41190.1 expansin EXLX1 family cellulose-binding protein [Streptomyces sp. NBC_00775]WUB25126.1 expansin EXLX1 family cellulose-binding protein [Streptomyces sp. NBC_00589]